MATPTDLPVVDHHCHLSPHGEGVAAARRFRSLGGTHLFLATQNYAPSPPTALEGYREQFETTDRLARQIRSDTGVIVHVVVAPFPVDLLAQADRLGLAPAETLHLRALDLAGAWVRERRAVALGEVGWPHFPTEPGLRASAERVFAHALGVARESDCPVVVHSEELDAGGYRRLHELARASGLAPSRVVKHYARSAVGADDRMGVAASYVATRELVRQALGQDRDWMLETDFLDDPRRPGAVLDLATVPRRVRALLAEDPGHAERLRIPFERSIHRTYGFTPRAEEAERP